MSSNGKAFILLRPYGDLFIIYSDVIVVPKVHGDVGGGPEHLHLDGHLPAGGEAGHVGHNAQVVVDGEHIRRQPPVVWDEEFGPCGGEGEEEEEEGGYEERPHGSLAPGHQTQGAIVY